ncbi:MAG: hypothetical protein HC831_24000 [Chloroflexia bacterium]|nr:hypothetical protein [Chloroflexia bacterium]
MWLYQLLLTKDEYIYVAGTLKGRIRIPLQKKDYAKLKANEDSEEGNPFLIKFDLEGKVIWATLLTDDKDSYRIFDDPPLTFDKKANQLTVKAEVRHSGGEDFPYMLKTFIG